MRSSRDYPRQRPPGRKRVVFLGDSYTAGDGVSNNQRFTDILEARFPHLDALNFGLNGSGTDQQLLVFETIAKDYVADAYVFCICVENIARNMYNCFPSFNFRERLVVYRPKPFFNVKNGGLVPGNQPVPLEKRSTDELGDWQCSFPYLPGETDPYAIYKSPESKHWLLMKTILERFLSQVSGAPVLIVPLPMFNHYLDEIPPTYMDRFAELDKPSSRVHVVDLLPAFLKFPIERRREFRFVDDPHYTAAAHEVVSGALEYNLAKLCPGIFD
jgi:carbamoyltransferase